VGTAHTHPPAYSRFTEILRKAKRRGETKSLPLQKMGTAHTFHKKPNRQNSTPKGKKI